ncbi:DUF2249 domain-containing protein [Pelomonas sp. APW6]|uniref:DUF2249 domain-containing protein n=1 Tax=Roseateles subflavus TaxID=3053353 RepID=A0ABT7LMH9_9BURK|nr:DUF2249 domain-containing protein [Pelomonas sp. APW6]MDL5034067.1 DUF2249 domain-containing protein [Pelomonas sp. APW6]
MTTLSVPRIHVPDLPPQERHPTLFSAFEALPVGGSFELSNDHNPEPLRRQFQVLWPDQFAWDALESGPELWKVRISRKPAGKSCCGCCS